MSPSLHAFWFWHPPSPQLRSPEASSPTSKPHKHICSYTHTCTNLFMNTTRAVDIYFILLGDNLLHKHNISFPSYESTISNTFTSYKGTISNRNQENTHLHRIKAHYLTDTLYKSTLSNTERTEELKTLWGSEGTERGLYGLQGSHEVTHWGIVLCLCGLLVWGLSVL